MASALSTWVYAPSGHAPPPVPASPAPRGSRQYNTPYNYTNIRHVAPLVPAHHRCRDRIMGGGSPLKLVWRRRYRWQYRYRVCFYICVGAARVSTEVFQLEAYRLFCLEDQVPGSTARRLGCVKRLTLPWRMYESTVAFNAPGEGGIERDKARVNAWQSNACT
ncbi:hypothetical protein EVAR_88508_1 [Eumeta japonica]|uniref:Uncharacterized protein n=1 Tax=Eumeta variegata TaxID=151549 RepID=A0A4C1XSD0_EUMVA|nr:hypothetical protein EVAR_88508_1 [Eumeta japonica]